jgi:SOS-response transcriptional repressor LexA
MPNKNPYYIFIKKLLKDDFRLTVNGFQEKYNLRSLSTIMNKLKNNPKKRLHPETISKIENALNIKIDDSNPENIIYKKLTEARLLKGDMQLFNYPIISHIHMGLSMESIVKDQTSGYVSLPYYKKGNCFAIVAHDDAMANKIELGDVVLVDMDEPISNDSIVVTLLKDGRQIIRKYREVAPNIIMLFTDNGSYAPITIQKIEIEVIYKIVGTWKKF